MQEKRKQKINKQKGAAMLVSVVFFLFTSLAIISGLVTPTVREFRTANTNLNSKQSYFLAESGSEDVAYRIINNLTVGNSEVITLGSHSVTTTTTDNLGTKDVIAVGDVSGYQRKTDVKLKAGVGTAFHYGIQIGQGGLSMVNSAKVIGNVYTYGNVVGQNSARIMGDVIVTSPTGIIDNIDIDGNSDSFTIRNNSTVGGNAKHSVLQNTIVTGNATVDSMTSCSVSGNAIYDTKSSCTVTGTNTTPNPNPYVPQPSLPLPISAEQIDAWEAEAAAGGTIGSQSYSSGSFILGPKKINGNLTISNSAQLTLTGTLWVTGQIILSNSAILRLDPLYGANSGVIVAGIDGSSTAGYVEISNSVQILGSGTSGSYLMLLSQHTGTTSNAIKMSNGSGAIILYAGSGKIEITNTAALNEVTANLLSIANSATVTYESGLANNNFSNGPSGAWEVQTWKEVQ